MPLNTVRAAADTDPSDNIRLFIVGSECGL
jgi:hypothetical protein